MVNKKVTIYTIAKEVGVSPSAVSRSFNSDSRIGDETRKKVLEVARKRGYVPNKMASRLSQKPVKIGVLLCGYIESYYSKILDGVKAAHTQYLDYKVECEIKTFSRGEHQLDKVLDALDDLKEKGCNGVIIHGITGDEIVKKIREMTRDGIKVVALHNDIPDSRRLFVSTIDTDTTAHIVANLFDLLLKDDKRKIIAFTGNMQSLIHSNIISSLKKYSDEYDLDLCESYDTQDDPELSEKQIAEAFKKHPDVNGIYISSSNSLKICEYIEKNGLRNVSVIASDIFAELSKYIYNGTVAATIFQNPYYQGFSAFENLYYNLTEGKIIPDVITVSPQIVTKANLFTYDEN